MFLTDQVRQRPGENDGQRIAIKRCKHLPGTVNMCTDLYHLICTSNSFA